MIKFCKKFTGIMAVLLAISLFSSNSWAAAPAAPTMTVTTNGLNLTVSWNTVTGATGYTLFYAPYPSATPLGSLDMGSQTSLSVTLTQGAAFYVAVKAYNASESSGYSNIEHFTITTTSTGGSVTDIDGNVYNTVTIGNQVWMKENLQVTKYRNGDAIPTTTADITGETSPKYQWAYSNDETYVASYGRLYTWFAATDSKGLCPAGWHVPTDAEWTTLTDYLGGAAGGKMKEAGTTHWSSPNTGADNSSGFTALPGGGRGLDGTFSGVGFGGNWWLATEDSAAVAWFRSLNYYGGYGVTNSGDKSEGFSVRCVKD